jgi:histidinol-phosphate aminotransferase
MIKPPEHIKTIKPYVPGKPHQELERELGIEGSVKLASNENPLGPSPLAVRALRTGMKELNRYPDGSCYYLRNALSGKLKIDPDELIFGNGSNELIELAVRTYLCPGDEAIMAHPSFVVYSIIVQAAKGKSVVVPLKECRHDLAAMALKITAKTRLIFIANPNNPTGTINTKTEMDSFMRKVPDNVLVIVDEAYYEYVTAPDYADTLTYLKKKKNILILRTFSKMYGLAGLRVGYGISNKKITSEMNKVRQPFNVNSPAQAAALAALEDTGHIENSKRTNERGKHYLYKHLKALNIYYIPTEANFIYITFPGDIVSKLHDQLLKEGVIIRPMGPAAARITIGLPAENRRLIKALKKFAMVPTS